MTDDISTLDCNLLDENSLFLSYMPFVKDGGLFVRTKDPYQLDDQVVLNIHFFDETAPYIVDGSVIWITPKGAQGNKPTGIGVQFTGENKQLICSKIETVLAGKIKSLQSTDTM